MLASLANPNPHPRILASLALSFACANREAVNGLTSRCCKELHAVLVYGSGSAGEICPSIQSKNFLMSVYTPGLPA